MSHNADKHRGELKKGLHHGMTTARVREETMSVRKTKRDTAIKRMRSHQSEDDLEAVLQLTDETVATIQRLFQSPDTLADGLLQLKKYVGLSEHLHLIQRLSLLPALEHALISNIPSTVADALWCLANFATGTHEDASVVAIMMPKIIQLLNHDSCTVQEQALWVIGNVAGDCDDCRRHTIPAIQPVAMMLFRPIHTKSSTTDAAYKVACAWVLSNILRGQTSAYTLLATGCVGDLFNLLNVENMDLSLEVAWIIAFLTGKPDLPLQDYCALGFMRIAQFLKLYSIDSPICVPLLISLFNMVDFLDVDGSLRLLSLMGVYLQPTSPVMICKEALSIVHKLITAKPDIIRCMHEDEGIFDGLFHSFMRGIFDLRMASLELIQIIFCNFPIIPKYFNEEVVERLVLCLREHDAKAQLWALLVIRALISYSDQYFTMCESLQFLDILDEVQYTSRNDKFVTLAKEYVEELYKKMEGDDIGGDEYDGQETSHMAREGAVIMHSAGRGRQQTKPAWMSHN